MRAQAAGHRLAGITTTSEFYLVPVAELADSLGLPGNPAEAMATCRNKARTRQALRTGGVPQPRFGTVTDVSTVDSGLDAVLAEVGLPCVVKPADDSGSNDVLLCDTPAEVAAHAARVLAVRTNVRDQPTAGTALVEEYAEGPELSVELFSVDGQASCVGITQKWVTGLPYFVEYQHIFPAELPEGTAADLVAAAGQALKATGFERGASHLEVKLTPAGASSGAAPPGNAPDAAARVSVIEINARLAGGMIPELVRLATGIDLLEQQLRAAAGLPVTLTPTRSRYAGIRFLLSPADGRLAAITGLDAARHVPGVDRVTVTAVPGAEVRRPRNAYDRLGYVIALGASYPDVEQALAAAVAHLEVVVEDIAEDAAVDRAEDAAVDRAEDAAVDRAENAVEDRVEGAR